MLMQQVNHNFEEALSILKSTYKIPFPDEVTVLVKEAQALLLATERPMLDAYYSGEICKETYTFMREYREYALAYLNLAVRLMEEFPHSPCEFGEADDAIHKAVDYLKLALKVECSCPSDSGCYSCSKSCDSSSSSSCGCDSSSSSSCGCDSSSSSSGCDSSSSSCGCDSSSSSCGCDSSSSSCGCDSSSSSCGCDSSSSSCGCDDSSSCTECVTCTDCSSSSSSSSCGCESSSSSSCSLSSSSSVSCGCH